MAPSQKRRSKKAAVEELLQRGLHRRYVQRDEELASPRGKIDLGWWMRNAGSGRPDFAIHQGQRVRALLDAKYRDLWEYPLPSDMLYQLALYALSQEAEGSAAILYPTMDSEAVEQVIEIREAVRGRGRATVTLRPVHLLALVELLNLPAGEAARRGREAFALRLAFGGSR